MMATVEWVTDQCILEQKQTDEQLMESAGNNKLPKWVLKDNDLTVRAQLLIEGLSQVAAAFEMHKTKELALPLVMTATVAPEALSKTYRKAIVDLLNSDSNDNVIGIDPDNNTDRKIKSAVASDNSQPDANSEEPQETRKLGPTRKLLSLVTTDELISNIRKALQNPRGTARLISSLAEIRPFEARGCDYNPDSKAYCVTLIDYQNAQRNHFAQTLFKDQCAAHGIAIDRETRYSSDMWLYRISLGSKTAMEAVRNFEGVHCIEEAIPIRNELGFILA